ncbi:MAG: hypothetical protein DRO01_00075 [Thermoproteota archaeon]|nr:MAG: hypothetical protein DRO01_00075 [Candidatus Korarchaeota archaeon]
MIVEKLITYRIPIDELLKKFRIKGNVKDIQLKNKELVINIIRKKETRRKKQEEEPKEEVKQEVVEQPETEVSEKTEEVEEVAEAPPVSF